MMARRHVVLGEERVMRQSALVEELRRDGHETTDAEQFERLLAAVP